MNPPSKTRRIIRYVASLIFLYSLAFLLTDGIFRIFSPEQRGHGIYVFAQAIVSLTISFLIERKKIIIYTGEKD